MKERTFLLILFCHLLNLFVATITGLPLALLSEDLLSLPNSLLGYLKGKYMEDRLEKLKKDLCPQNGFLEKHCNNYLYLVFASSEMLESNFLGFPFGTISQF